MSGNNSSTASEKLVLPTSLLYKRLFEAAKAWWIVHRPATFTEAEHLSNPTINTNGAEEHKLARSVTVLLKESWRSDDAKSLVEDLLSLARDLEHNKRPISNAFFKRHEIYRRAEVFLGKRVVSEDTTPAPTRPKRLVRLHADDDT